MLSKEQSSWISNLTGIDLGAAAGAAAGAVDKTIHSLPGSAMLPDCRPVKGKVRGPAEHLLCETHGHIVDIKEKKIIAISLQQYESQHLGEKAGHGGHGAAAPAAHGASQPPPAATPAAGGAGGAAPPTPGGAGGAAAPADAEAAKAAAEIKRLLSQMQLETEDLAFIRSEHEKLAGGGRLNRAVSWISDKVGGADDPGDELAGIAGQMMREQMAGMAAVGGHDFDAAHKHLETMKALNQKAHRLWSAYTGDTSKGADRMVTGLTAVSKAGDVATMGLNVVAPGTGKLLSVVKDGSVVLSKLAFGEKVNWAEFTIDMAFDLFVGGEGSGAEKAAEKLAGPLAKDLAPKLTEALAKKWGLEAVAKKLGSKVTEAAVEKYILTYTEEKIKDYAKDEVVKPMVEKVAKAAEGKEMTNGELVELMTKRLTDPSGQLAGVLFGKVMADFRP